MKNVGTIVAAAFLALVLLLYMCTFQVRFTEVALVKTFGKPANEAITEPGLKLKWPPPMQTVVRYDRRMRLLEDRTEETRTVDNKNVIVTTFTLWRIGDRPGDALKFHTNFPEGVEDGEKKLRTTIITKKHAIIGQHAFDEFVSTEPDTRKLDEIEQEIRADITKSVREDFGVEIIDFGIKKLALPQSVTTTIFSSMKQREETRAARYESEGNARARDIEATARATEQRIMAAAREKVAEIESEANRIVGEYYKEFDEYPNLRIFLDNLRMLERALGERSTIILDSTHEPWNIVHQEERAKIKPAELTDAE